MEANGQALDDVGLTRYCCRRMLLSHVNVIDQLLQYSNNPGEKSGSKHAEALPEDYQEPVPESDSESEQDEIADDSEEDEYNYVEPDNDEGGDDDLDDLDEEDDENYTYIAPDDE